MCDNQEVALIAGAPTGLFLAVHNGGPGSIAVEVSPSPLGGGTSVIVPAGTTSSIGVPTGHFVRLIDAIDNLKSRGKWAYTCRLNGNGSGRFTASALGATRIITITPYDGVAEVTNSGNETVIVRSLNPDGTIDTEYMLFPGDTGPVVMEAGDSLEVESASGAQASGTWTFMW